MRSRYLILLLTATIVLVAACAQQTPQTPSASTTPAASSTPAAQPSGNMAQLMRGVLFPASNVIFAAQNENPENVKPAADPSTALNPLEGSFGKWQAVENAGIALSESANLLSIPGRK